MNMLADGNNEIFLNSKILLNKSDININSQHVSMQN